MSAVGSVVGIQEGIEAGLVTGGLAASEQHTGRAIATGLGATAVGVAAGTKFGEGALSIMDDFVGDGGVAFLPAVAIGTSVTWHNLREHVPQQSAQRFVKGLPYVLGAGFAFLEGVESGILSSSVDSGLLAAEITTLTAAGVMASIFGGIKLYAEKFSPRRALRAARLVALAPAVYLGAKGVPELVDDPKVGGIVVAGVGTVAVGSAIKSFFKKKSQPTEAANEAEDFNQE